MKKKVDLEKVIYKIRYLHHIFALLVVSWLGLRPDSSPVTGTHTPIESLSASRIDFLVLYLNFLFLYSYRIDSEVEHNSVRGCWLHIKELYGQKLSVEKLCVCSSASSWPVIAEAKPPGCSPSDDDECPRRPSSFSPLHNCSSWKCWINISRALGPFLLTNCPEKRLQLIASLESLMRDVARGERETL